jgi:uncharacterized membrane protein YphA (DoxX/SURF4 family)
MNERMVVGLTPWLPWPLSRWPWWTEPVRAERLAALRIGLAIVLLVDVLVQYLPHYADYFGAGSLGSPEVFAGRNTEHWHWSLLRALDDSRLFIPILLLWAAAAVLLLVGWRPRWAAFVAWALSVSFLNLNYGLHNSGDRIRSIVLFYLMLTPCGAAWSLDACRQRKKDMPTGPAFISPWALRLLFIQMTLIYFFNGFYKLVGPEWRTGEVLHSILGNVQWARWAFAELPAPYPVTKVLTWLVLAWELGFPILVIMKPLRIPTLWFGVALHIGLAVSLELGLFSFYMLCLYLPLVPWERWRKQENA